MANKQNKRGRSKGDGRFIRLFHHLLKSEAGKSLTPAEMSVMIRVMELYNGDNNGRIAMSNRRASELCNINKDTAGKALRGLIDKGLLIITTPSSFTTKTRKATEYEITCYPPSKNRPAKNTFQNWKAYGKKNQQSQNRDATVPKEGHKSNLRLVT